MAKVNDGVIKALENEGSKPENTANRSNKTTRVPIGTARGRLEINGKEPGFHYAIINDYNVDEALDQGFEFVSHGVKVGTRRIGVGKREDGSAAVWVPVGAGVTGYLMRIPQEIYDEDMKKYHKNIVDGTEEGIRRQSVNNGLQGTIEIARKPQSE